jgi:hypothetical protein
MTQVPWSPEGEFRLRQRIVSLQIASLLSLAIGAISFVGGLTTISVGFPNMWLWLMILAGVFLTAFCLFLAALARCWTELGWEEAVSRGQSIPGSGMLANKPRDTSRLTRWIEHVRDEAPLGFTCPCLRPYDWEQMEWTANVLECEEEFDDVPAVAVDPGGGRWVLLCPCGIGHYMRVGNR